MPELAEVEYYRKCWNPGLRRKVQAVHCHGDKRIFREVHASTLTAGLVGRIMRGSETHGKQMLFRFSGGACLGVHLGMSGKLFHANGGHDPGKHDHLVISFACVSLVFQDYRQFGLLRFHNGPGLPKWWAALPPGVLEEGFDLTRLNNALQRRSRSPLKAALLDQAFFPGIGNWMGDEILWRAGLHPSILAGNLGDTQILQLFNRIKEVSADALRVIGTNWEDPPQSWLFPHRWKDGGTCPRTGTPLVRERIGGRTTCYSLAAQPMP